MSGNTERSFKGPILQFTALADLQSSPLHGKKMGSRLACIALSLSKKLLQFFYSVI